MPAPHWTTPDVPAAISERMPVRKSRVARKSADAHAVAPEQSEAVLLLVDVINDFDFPESARLLRFAIPAARRIAKLKQRLSKRGIPAIYVNDNFGRWQSDFKKQVSRCIADESRGAPVARLL